MTRHLLAQGNDVSEPRFQEDWLAILELGLLGNTAQVQGRKEVRVDEFLWVLDEAAASVLELRGRMADTMSWCFRHEAYQTLGLEPDTMIWLPYSKRPLFVK